MTNTKTKNMPLKVLATAALGLSILTGFGTTPQQVSANDSVYEPPEERYERGPNGKFIVPTWEEQQAAMQTFTGRIDFKDSNIPDGQITGINLKQVGNGESPINSLMPVVVELQLDRYYTHREHISLEYYKSKEFQWVVNGRTMNDFKPEVGKSYNIAIKHNLTGKVSNPVYVKYTEPLDVPLVEMYKMTDEEPYNGGYSARFKSEKEFVHSDVNLPQAVSGLPIAEMVFQDFGSIYINDLTVPEGVVSTAFHAKNKGFRYAFLISGELNLPSTLRMSSLSGTMHTNIFGTESGILKLPNDEVSLEMKGIVLSGIQIENHLPDIGNSHGDTTSKQTEPNEVYVSLDSMPKAESFNIKVNTKDKAKEVFKQKKDSYNSVPANEVFVSMDEMKRAEDFADIVITPVGK